MPSITRSKDELARIVALLESDTFDTEEQLAYAVLKEAAEIIAGRGMWMVRPSNAPVWWGPYWTLGQAEKAWETQVGPVAGGGGRGEVAWVSPWRDTPTPSSGTDLQEKCLCGHPRWWHTTEGKRLYCGPKSAGCKCSGGFTRP